MSYPCQAWLQTGLPTNNICGGGSQLSGTSDLTFSGGSLGPGDSCSFSVTLQVPINATPGSTAINITSQADGMLNGFAVTGFPAIDDLIIAISVPDCDDNILTIDDLILGTTPQTTSFHAIQTLRSNGNVTSTRNLMFKAGQSIELQAPFSIENGGILDGIIEDCPN